MLTKHQGVYSGVVDHMNGGPNATSTPEILNSQALRGFQITDPSGAVEFETLVPGHYRGRTHHIHVATHLNPSVQQNLTIASGVGQVLHVGQLYLDQDLLMSVEQQEPYNSNKVPMKLNKDDFLLMQGSAGGADPLLEYVLLGKDVSEGVFGWINFGVDTKASRKMRAATVCNENGCTSEPRKKFDGWEKTWKSLKEMFGAGGKPGSEPAANATAANATAADATAANATAANTTANGAGAEVVVDGKGGRL